MGPRVTTLPTGEVLHYAHDKMLAWCLAHGKHQCEVCLSTESLEGMLTAVSLSLQIPSSRGQCTSQSKWTGLSQGTDSWEMGKQGCLEGQVGWKEGKRFGSGALRCLLWGVGSYWQGSWREGALLESGSVHQPSPIPLPHRTVFLSDPADGSLYILGTQKQQGLMVCFTQCLDGRGSGLLLARARRGLSGQNLSVLRRMKSESPRARLFGGPGNVGDGGDSGCICRAG